MVPWCVSKRTVEWQISSHRARTYEVGVELQGVDLNTEGGDVLLLELAGQVALDEGGLAGTAVTAEDELEGRGVLLGHFEV
jgi:hypothetical protein